jgi:hypothetical protein
MKKLIISVVLLICTYSAAETKFAPASAVRSLSQHARYNVPRQILREEEEKLRADIWQRITFAAKQGLTYAKVLDLSTSGRWWRCFDDGREYRDRFNNFPDGLTWRWYAKTMRRIAAELRKLGYRVKDDINEYDDGFVSLDMVVVWERNK